MLLKVLFGTFAAPEDLAKNLRAGAAEHEMRLLAYRQTTQFIPARGEFQREGRRHNPYASESEADPYFDRIVRFAIEFEKVYLRWLYETLEFVEGREEQIQSDNEYTKREGE